MSGGSFNYLCHKEAFDLLAYSEELDGMIAALRQYENGEKVAQTTVDLLADIQRIKTGLEERLEPLREVWRAVEWHHSSDYSQEQAQEAIDKFLRWPSRK